MDQPDQAGQEAAAPQVIQIHPLAELEEAQWLLACYRNRNLLMANDRHLLRETIEQQKSLIDHLKAKDEEAK